MSTTTHRPLTAAILAAVMVASALTVVPALSASAGGSGSNLWSNPGVETDSNSDGVPDTWARGGSNTGFAQWTTATAHGGSRSLCIVDNSTSQYGEWYSSQAIATPGSSYELTWWQGYQSSLDLYVQYRFLTSGGVTIGSPVYLPVRGNSNGWIEGVHTATAPAGAASLFVAITSDTTATGSVCLDDISVTTISPTDTGGDRNLWSGTALTADRDSTGRPDGWFVGGSGGTTTWESGSPRGVCLNDASASTYTEWYSAGQPIVQPGLDYEVRWEQKHAVSAPMYVQVRFLDRTGALIGSASYFSFTGTAASYQPQVHLMTAPAGAYSIAFNLTSDVAATGTACLRSPSAVRAPMPSPDAMPNLMVNPMLEVDGNSDGLPDGWQRGGTSPSDAVWSTATYRSPGHAVCLDDVSAAKGEGPQWYQDEATTVQPGGVYELTWSEWVDTPDSDDDTPQTDLFLQAQYFSSSDPGTILPGSTMAMTNGDSGGWREGRKQLEIPAGADRMRLVLGGDQYATGVYCVDDLKLSGPIPGSLRHLSEYPAQPSTLDIPDWDAIGSDYAELAFDTTATGEHLPLIGFCDVETVAGYTGEAFAIQSYVGVPQFSAWESVTTFGALKAATLTGHDMADYDSTDYVDQMEAFYSETNGHAVIFNNPTFVNGPDTCDDNDTAVAGDNAEWYTLLPTVLWGEVIAHYDDPAHAHLVTQFLDTVDAWIGAIPNLQAADWNVWSYNFATDSVNQFADIQSHIDGAWEGGNYDFLCVDPDDPLTCKASIEQYFRDHPVIQPDIGVGIAWIALQAYNITSDTDYLDAATEVMDDMAERSGTATSLYEALGYYAPLLAARLNAQHGETFDLDTFLEWIYTDGFEGPRPSWGLAADTWGSFDAYGIPTGNGSSGGYAFMMNTGIAAGALAPTLRYDSRYANEIGKWLLHVANNARMFYPGELPPANQHDWSWANDNSVLSIPYEGVKRYFEGQSPYGTSDVRLFGQPSWEDFGNYSAWGGGVLAALFDETTQPEIVQVDLRATDTMPGASYPTYLYYNPASTAKSVDLAVGGTAVSLYDTVRHEFIATSVTGTTSVSVPAGSSLVVVVVPASGPVTVSGSNLLVNSVVVDYRYIVG